MRWLVRPARVLLIVYSLLLAVMVFSPDSHTQSGLVKWLSEWLREEGLQGATFARLEVVMNAVIVAPVTFLATIVYPRRTWRDWTAFGFLAAVTIEAVQAFLLPERQASFSDVVANTFGAMLGAVVFNLLSHSRSDLFPKRPSNMLED